jgi:hypothetical protein
MREYGLKIALAATLGTLAAMGYYEHVTKAPAEPAVPVQPTITVTADPSTPLSVVIVKLDDGRSIVVMTMPDGIPHAMFATPDLLADLKKTVPEDHALTIDPKGTALEQPQGLHYFPLKKHGFRCSNVEWMTDKNFHLWTETRCSDI